MFVIATLLHKVFLNPIVWIVALADLTVYVVRFAELDWGPSMLQDMGLSPVLFLALLIVTLWNLKDKALED